MIQSKYYVNVVELMGNDIDFDRAEDLSELPITKVSGCDVIYYE